MKTRPNSVGEYFRDLDGRAAMLGVLGMSRGEGVALSGTGGRRNE